MRIGSGKGYIYRASFQHRLHACIIVRLQCSICNLVNNKPRVVVIDFRLQYNIMASLTKWCY